MTPPNIFRISARPLASNGPPTLITTTQGLGPPQGVSGSWVCLSWVNVQASHSRATLAVGVVRVRSVGGRSDSCATASASLSPRACLTILHCARTFILTPPPEPAAAAAACPAAQKVEYSRLAKVVRHDPPVHIESPPVIGSVANHTSMRAGSEICRRRPKSKRGDGPFTFTVSRAGN